ncbi:uncharacterized protein LOC103521913 [Diaphorina citri]|uniref:Uncharacterized protein LOC103521913 n=1 Tax=Diaphorina citri TaxID=121845 RepID=A0A3Q0JIJ3_DIACI|nr:uncharacterized protein LOC103521913 [Diaphorina citri]
MGDPMDFFSCEGLKNMKKKIYCVNECIGKKQELLNEDGSLNQEKIQAYVTAENFKEDWQKDLVTAGLNECLKKDFSLVKHRKLSMFGFLYISSTQLLRSLGPLRKILYRV